jgi:hypothetical protein
MRHVIYSAALVILLSATCSSFGQGVDTVDRERLKQAEKTADSFVRRFVQTLDFGTVWKEFHLKDPSCTYQLDGPWKIARDSASADELERLFIAYMNCFSLGLTYRLAFTRISDDDDDLDRRLPKVIRVAEQQLVTMEIGGKNNVGPPTRKDVNTAVKYLDRLATIWRKRIPRNVMQTALWRKNIRRVLSKEGRAHLDVGQGSQSDFCVPDDVKYYIVDRGLFYFYLIEEDGVMKVVRFGLGD